MSIPQLAVIALALAADRPPEAVAPTTLTAAQAARDQARVPLATSVVDAYPNWNGFFSTLVANWSPDGATFLFGSTRDGLPEIYAGATARPANAPAAITHGPERAIWARYTPDGKSLLFLRDAGGNEQHHIWRADKDGANAVDLTSGDTLQRGEPFIVEKRPDTMIYDGSRTTSPQAFMFEQKIAPEKARVVYTNPGPGGTSDVTADGTRALYFDFRAPSDVVILEITTATGKARRVYPAEGKKVGVQSAKYASDDARIFVTTDEGAESSVLLALDGKSFKETGRYVNESPRTAPMNVTVAPAGHTIAVSVDAGTHGEIRLLDERTLKHVRDVAVPLGLVYAGSFKRDGSALSLLVSTPERRTDVFVADVATGAVMPLRNEPRPGLDGLLPLDVSIARAPAFDGLQIPINVYLPRGAAQQKKQLPVVAIFHGGPASSYAVRWNPYTRFLVSLGYAVIEPNVRGSTGFGRGYEQADNREKRADWLKDVESVNAWVKQQPWCDPQRVVVWGQSYGGYTTLMALTRQPKLWRAGVDLYGVADLKKFLLSTDAAIRAIFVEEFGDLEKDAALLERFSPMADVDKITAPLFVYTGQNDPRVPRSESDAIVRALRARNMTVEYMVAANEGHTADRRETKIELLTRSARFLEDALR